MRQRDERGGRLGLKELVAVILTSLLAGPAFAQFDFLEDGAAEETVQVRALAQSEKIPAGGQMAIAVVFEISDDFHIWPSKAQDVLPDGFDFAIRTTLNAEPVDGMEFGAVQWPIPKDSPVPDLINYTDTPLQVPTYHDGAVAYLPVTISPDATPGPRTIIIRSGFQACDETECLQPDSAEVEVTFEIVANVTDRVDSADTELFADFDPRSFAISGADAAAEIDGSDQPTRSFFGIPVPTGSGPAGLAGLALLAALGGFILNLTPCVLPVIPIKVLTISNHAGSPGKSLYLGLWMAAGVIAFWLAIGLPVALLTSVTDPSRIFGFWPVTLGIGILIAVMGVGIMGLFQIKLPQAVYMVNPKADSAWGSFMFGVMTAILGLPCFGFVAGALLAGAATLPPSTIMVIFTALGAGMAAPYLVLAAKPSWVDKMPRTGPASELIKQVMGLLLLAAAAFFIGAGVMAFVGGRPALLTSFPWWGKVIHWWAVGLFVVAACVWLTWRTFQITPRPTRRAIFTVISIFIASLGVMTSVGMTRRALNDFWIPYTEEAFAEGINNGQIVVIDFTADWCINCKVLEVLLNRDPVKGILLSQEVLPLKADVTSDAAPGWDKMDALGQTGIPLLVIYGPGLDEPWLANAYTAEKVVAAIDSARPETVREARASGTSDSISSEDPPIDSSRGGS